MISEEFPNASRSTRIMPSTMAASPVLRATVLVINIFMGGSLCHAIVEMTSADPYRG
jgi:hypothetical protein